MSASRYEELAADVYHRLTNLAETRNVLLLQSSVRCEEQDGGQAQPRPVQGP